MSEQQEPAATAGSPTAIAVELDAAGRVVVVKRPPVPAARARIAAEAQILDAARHPGVIDLLAAVDIAGEPAVVTRWVGPHSLAGTEALPLSQAAGIMAALADCVADLHELGVVHRAIRADHVILSPDGKPVLCGFGQAQRLTAADPSAEALRADDVAGLGSLLRALCGEQVDLEPIPQRRGWRRRPRWQGYQRRALLMLADQATHDDDRLRPTARSLATAIHDSIPDATLAPVAPRPDIPPSVLAPAVAPDAGRTDAPEREPEPAVPPAGVEIAAGPPPSTTQDRSPASHVRHGRAGPIVLGVLAAALIVYGLSALWPFGASGGGGASSRALPAATPPVSTRHPSPAPSRAAAAARACPPAPAAGVDLDADGCPDPVVVTAGVVEARGIRYAVGRPGDRVLVGDWRCDGHATAAVLRPGTGEVFLFAGWATQGEPMVVKAIARVPGASALEADRGRGGCAALRIRTAAGTSVAVPMRPAP